MCTRYEAGNVEQLDGNRTFAVDTRAVIWSTSGGKVVPDAGASDLQVADGALRVDGREPSMFSLVSVPFLEGCLRKISCTGQLSYFLCADQLSPTNFGRSVGQTAP
jgi:hypothetical protein